MMPAGSAEQRGDQLATLKAIHHSILTDPAMGDLLLTAANDQTLDEWQQANLREMTRQWQRASALEEELVEAIAKVTARCESAWRTAREEDNYTAVSSHLNDVLELIREQATALGETLDCTPYDALLDTYAPGISSAQLDSIFAELAASLPALLGEIREAQSRQTPPVNPDGPFSMAIQRQTGTALMERIGFDFERGRLDESVHPFSSGRGDDLRITTRYDEADFTSGLMGVLHETGHALYERNLPHDWRHQPVGQSRGMDVHESQSLLIEMQACRSPEFLSFAVPMLRNAYTGSGLAWETDNLVRLYRVVAPDFIRVDADEVTYPGHIILRYELERAMIAGDLAVADLPGAWADGMERLLGITPPNDRLGCLQDIHWYDGAWGYFPSYTLGAMTAAQLYRAAVDQVPEITAGLSRGEFAPLMGWLAENIHNLGSRFDAPELIERATGEPLNPQIFLDHLRLRYLG